MDKFDFNIFIFMIKITINKQKILQKTIKFGCGVWGEAPKKTEEK